MEIRSNNTGPNANDRIDITQSMRDSIRSNTPSLPLPPKQAPASDAPANPKRIKNARATYQRELSEQKRVREARDRFEAAQMGDKVTVSSEAQELADSAVRPTASSDSVQPKQPAANDLPIDPQRIKNARATYQRELSEQKRVREARDRFEATQAGDKMTVSPQAQELADTAIRPAASEIVDRAARVAELKSQFESGRLNVDGLIAETAYRMLSSD